MGTINKVFLHNGDPQNGAIAQLWKITAFAAYVDSTEDVLDNPLEAYEVECLTTGGGTFAVGDVIKIVNECCLIWKISGDTIYIIRGWHGTTPAQHPVNTDIYDETITPPVVDDAVPGAGQQGGDITTGVAYGGDGAYRFDDVPEMEYYASVTYDAHITYVHCFVERNDITPEQIMTVRGDMLYRDANTVTRKAIGAVGFFPLSDGTDWDWTSSGGFISTREQFWPIAHSSAGTAPKGDYGAAPCTGGATANINGHFPHDFSAIDELVAVVICDNTNGAANIDIESDYGTAGENYNIHTEQDVGSTYATNVNQILEIDLSGIFTAPPVAGDYFGVEVQMQEAAETIHVLGIRLKYT